METRWLFHRHAACRSRSVPHFDMLHPARRLWRRATGRRRTTSRMAGCRLGTLERVLCDVTRVGDVPGHGDPGALLPVSCAAATRGRSSRCSSTIGSISSRWPRSWRARCSSRGEGTRAAATRPRRSRSAGLRARRGVDRARRRAITAADGDLRRALEVTAEALYRLRPAPAARAPLRRGRGCLAATARADRAAQASGAAPCSAHCASSPSRRSPSITSTASATTMARASWRCSRSTKSDEAARRGHAPPAGAARAEDVEQTRSPEGTQTASSFRAERPRRLERASSAGAATAAERRYLAADGGLLGLRGLRRGLAALGRLHAEPLGEALHAAFGVDQLLPAR